MENEAVTGQLIKGRQKSSLKFLTNALSALRKLTMQFLLPLIAIGPALIGAEKLAETMGFHGSDAQFIRMLMLGVYALIIFTMVGSKRIK